MSVDRELTSEEQDLVARAREKATVLYRGEAVAHRSCGIALAETFGLGTRPYQALRRGGITGEGECGAIKAGELVLGELAGDPDPTGPVTPALREAIAWYRRELLRRLARGERPDLTCNTLTRPLGDFAGEPRRCFCTSLVGDVAELVAEALLRHGVPIAVGPIPER